MGKWMSRIEGANALAVPEALSLMDEAQRKLSVVADEMGHSLADLLEWYRDDLDTIAAMPMEDVIKLVTDHKVVILNLRR
ncbi:MAG: hypothetical protein RPU90_08620 [Candidatus Sedimenticola sp. (ex Thyasira tokunagai)]